MKNEITVSVQSTVEILGKNGLSIPDYQRPYKWERRQVRNLFYDVCEAMETGAREYRLGSIILHRKDTGWDIVDGQQRLITLSLFLYALYKNNADRFIALLSEQFTDTSCKHANDNYDQCN